MSYLKHIKKQAEKSGLLYRCLVVIHNHYYNLFYSSYNQISNFTTPNRYPELLKMLTEKLSDRPELKVLSYGCSTGEECFSLNTCFSEASILGVDINKRNLQIARKKNDYENIRFEKSNKTNINKNGPYDLITAMSVFCRWPASKYYKDLSKIYTFKKFEKNLELLDSVLKKNGFLVITNANYRFIDSQVSAKYKKIDLPREIEPDLVPKFAADGKTLPSENFRNFLYMKQSS